MPRFCPFHFCCVITVTETDTWYTTITARLNSLVSYLPRQGWVTRNKVLTISKDPHHLWAAVLSWKTLILILWFTVKWCLECNQKRSVATWKIILIGDTFWLVCILGSFIQQWRWVEWEISVNKAVHKKPRPDLSQH